jgi:hypothetical protein
LDALEHIRHIDHAGLISRAFATTFDHKVRALTLVGVTVRVNPTNLLTADRLGQKALAVGVLKPFLSKTKALSADEGRVYAALLHWFAETEFANVGAASPDLCAVCDVFARKLHYAPGKYKKVRLTIEASCQEIMDRWASFTPRPATKKQAKRP